MVCDKEYDEDDFWQYLTEIQAPVVLSKPRSCYAILDTYCHLNNLLQKPLLQTTDPEVIRAVQGKVENSRVLQTQYPEDYPMLVCALQYYSDYIASRQSGTRIDATHTAAQDDPAPAPTPAPTSPARAEKTLKTIDFQKVYDLTGSNPKSLTYCGKALLFGYTWTDLYVRVVLYMCKEHPQVLRPGLSFSKQHPRVELGSAADASGMQKPCAVPGTDLFVETKLTANEMLARIKYLIELCHMEYTDVVIQYKTLHTSHQTAGTPVLLDPVHVKTILQQYYPYGFHTNVASDMKKFRACYAAAYADPLPSTDGKILSVIRKLCIIHNKVAYLPGLVPMNKPASPPKAQPLYDPLHELLQEERYADLYHALIAENITTIEALQNINLWSFMNEHNLYPVKQRLAISTELAKILQNQSRASASTPRYAILYGDSTYTGNTPSEAFVAFLTAIAAKYPLKFRDLIGVSHPSTMCIVIYRHDPTGHKLKLMNPEAFVDSDLTREKIELYIPWICGRCGADATFSVKECPEATEASVTQNHALPPEPVEKPAPVLPETPATTAPKTADSLENVFMTLAEQYLLTRDLDGATYEELLRHLRCSLPYAKAAVRQSTHIIEMNHRLYHDEAFVDFEEGTNAIADILEKLLKKNGGVATAAQLWEYAQSELSMFLNDNDITDKQAVYDLAKHLFDKIGYQGKHYAFNANVYISLPEVSADSCSSVIQKYARDKGTTVTFQELEEYTKRLGLNTANLRSVLRSENRPAFLLYTENEYILTELIHIDDAFLEQIQSALTHLFADVGDHIILRQIAGSWYTLLPTLPTALEWTPLLLQQILWYYTKRLGARTIQALDSQNSSTLHAMLVQSDSWIRDFRDAVAIYLHDTWPDKQSFFTAELRRILVDAGMIGSGELQNSMPKALGGDPRFLWNRDGDTVTVRL